MIPKDNEFEVYVGEGVVVEIWHGRHVTSWGAFGADWDGGQHCVTWPGNFAQPDRVEVEMVDQVGSAIDDESDEKRRDRARSIAWLVAGLAIQFAVAWALHAAG